MKFKEFRKKYKDYSIMVQGKPLDEQVIPYTFLPKKKLDDCEVVDYKIINDEHIVTSISFKNGKKKEISKGYIRCYVK